MSNAPSIVSLEVDGWALRWGHQPLSRDQAARWLRWRRPSTVELRLHVWTIRVPRERLLDWLAREEPLDAVVRRELAYEILALPSESGLATVKRAYRRLARLHHPDRGGSPEAMRAVNLAYRQLRSHRPEPEPELEPELERELEPRPMQAAAP
jgi:DnaJ-like protein